MHIVSTFSLCSRCKGYHRCPSQGGPPKAIAEDGLYLGKGCAIGTPGKLDDGKAIYGTDGGEGGTDAFVAEKSLMIGCYIARPAASTRLLRKAAQYMEDQHKWRRSQRQISGIHASCRDRGLKTMLSWCNASIMYYLLCRSSILYNCWLSWWYRSQMDMWLSSVWFSRDELNRYLRCES